MYLAPSRATRISYRSIHSPQSQHTTHAPLASSCHVSIIEWSHVIPTRPAPELDLPLAPFVLYNGLKKKKIKFQNLKIQKKKMWDILFWFYLHEPRSSQAIKPLSWDLEPRPFEDPSLWATKSQSKPLSHDSTKPSQDLLQAKLQATEPSSRDPSYRAEIRAKPSRAKIFELFFCKQIQRFH